MDHYILCTYVRTCVRVKCLKNAIKRHLEKKLLKQSDSQNA